MIIKKNDKTVKQDVKEDRYKIHKNRKGCRGTDMRKPTSMINFC